MAQELDRPGWEAIFESDRGRWLYGAGRQEEARASLERAVVLSGDDIAPNRDAHRLDLLALLEVTGERSRALQLLAGWQKESAVDSRFSDIAEDWAWHRVHLLARSDARSALDSLNELTPSTPVEQVEKALGRALLDQRLGRRAELPERSWWQARVADTTVPDDWVALSMSLDPPAWMQREASEAVEVAPLDTDRILGYRDWYAGLGRLLEEPALAPVRQALAQTHQSLEDPG